MTDYSVWERLAKKNELKARGTLLMALPNKHQLKFNIYKDAKTLMEAIEKSTNEPVSVVACVSAASAKIPVSTLPNVDTLSNARIGRNLGANGPTSMGFNMSKVECYNCHMKGHYARECSYDWSFQVEEEPTNYALMAFTSSSSSSFDNVVLKLVLKLMLLCRLESVEARLLVYQQNETIFEDDIKLLKLEVQLRDNALVVLRQKIKKAEQERDDLQLKLEKYQSGEGYHAVPPPYTRTFMPPKHDLVFHDAPNVNTTVHTAFNVELSHIKPDTNLSHTHRPSAPIIKDWVSDSEDDYEAKLTHNVPSFVQPNEQVKTPRSSVKPVKTSILANNHKTYIPKPKSNGNSRNHAQRGNHQQYARMTLLNPQRHVVPIAVLTKSKLVSLTAAREVTTAVSPNNVTRPRTVKTIVTKPHSPPRRHISRSPSPKASNFPPKVTAAKAPKGNPQHALKDKRVIDSGFSRHMTGNMSYLSESKEINGRYVAFGGNLKGDTKFIVLSPEFKLLDENQVLLRVPRENNITPSIGFIRPFGCPVTILNTLDPLGKFDRKADEGFLVGYSISSKALRVFNSRTRILQETLHINFLENKPNVAGSGPIWLFDIDTLTKTMNYQPVTSSGSNNPQNTDGDTAFEVKEPEFERRKPKSEFYGSLSSSAQAKKHDDKTKREDKGKKSEDITYSDDEEDVGADADFTNLETTITISPIPTTRIHKDHPVRQIIGDLSSVTQTTSITRVAKDQEPKRVHQTLKDPSWIEAMQEELLQFKMQKVWVLVDLPNGKRAIGTKWVFRNKKDERGIVVRNKAQLIAQGHNQKEGIDYEEVFAPVAKIEAIRLFLAYASFMGFMVYQMDVKSAFLYGTIEEEVYVCQPLGFKDPNYPDKALYGLHQAPRACHDKYIAEILRKFDLTDGKSASTSIDTEKPLLKDPNGEDVDVHTYRSMIGSLMYLTSSRLDIMFAVCAYACFQVTPKVSQLHAVKRIFRYLKGKPHLGLWYPKDSPFNLVAYSYSDYAGASLDRKSTTRGCQFLRCRLISWQCKKQIVISTSSTEAEYVAATSCCAQVLWIQNQLLDYG
nr:putative ribonuclease H-like domain-containing protein [Tanacetum cinerariifolium]